MTLVAGVDSSTQSCKIVIVDAETGAIVREGRARAPRRHLRSTPTAWWDALQTAIADAGGLDDVAAIAVGGQQHGMVVLDADGRVIRDALLWNDTRSAWRRRRPRSPRSAPTSTRAAPASCPSPRSRRRSCAGCATHEPENAARVAAVALPHDWLTWRLRGYGPAGESPLGPELDALTTDRSDASGTAYWSATTGRVRPRPASSARSAAPLRADPRRRQLGAVNNSGLPTPSSCRACSGRATRSPRRGSRSATAPRHRSSGRARATTPPRPSASARRPATSSSRSARAAPSSP